MPSIQCNEVTALMTSNGTAGGVITIADTTQFYVNAKCNLQNLSVPSQLCVIVQIISSTQLAVRFLSDPLGQPTYGRSNASAFLAGSSINQYAQVVPINPSFSKPTSL